MFYKSTEGTFSNHGRAKLRCLSFLIGSTTYSTSMCIHDFNFLTILIAQKLSFEKLCFIGEGGKRSYQKTWTCSSTLSLKCLPIISWDFQMEFKIVTVYSLPQTTMCISSNLAFSCPLIFWGTLSVGHAVPQERNDINTLEYKFSSCFVGRLSWTCLSVVHFSPGAPSYTMDS